MRLDDLPGDGCSVCGADLSHMRVSAVYCSRKCWNAHMLELERAARAEVLANKSCRNCGGSLAHCGKVWAAFCSRKCQRDYFNGLTKAAGAAARAGKMCKGCGAAFDARRIDQVFCTYACGSRFRGCRTRRRAAERARGKRCTSLRQVGGAR